MSVMPSCWQSLIFIYLFIFHNSTCVIGEKSINDAPGKILQQEMIKSLSST